MTAPAPVTQKAGSEQKQRRGRRARTDVAIVMAGVSILSVLIVGIFNLVTARDFLTTTVEQQLVSVGEYPRDESLDLAEHAALSSVCLAILNLDEALTRE